MDNNSIRNILDGLTKRGVLSADGRRQVFAILLEQAKEHEQEKKLLQEDVTRLRSTKNALTNKLNLARTLIPKSKLAQLDG